MAVIVAFCCGVAFCWGGAMAKEISYEWEFQRLELGDEKTIVMLGKISRGSYRSPEGQSLIAGLSLGCGTDYRLVDLHFQERLKGPYSLTLVGSDGELEIGERFSLSPERASLKGVAPEELLKALMGYDKLEVRYETENGDSDTVEFALDFKEEYFEGFEEVCGWKR